MRVITADALDRLLTFPPLVEAIAEAFRDGVVAPDRHHHELQHGDAQATHLLMPAWTRDAPGRAAYLGTKVVNVFPDNAAQGLPAVSGVYVLQSGETGVPLAIMEGASLTRWRTAAASALAARFLARPDAARLTMVGAGTLAPFLVRAHASVRPIRTVTVWNRRPEGAEALARSLAEGPWRVEVADDLEAAVRDADIVSCATLSERPLVLGTWLRPGTHVDLVGAFNMRMREADDAALLRSSVFVDTAGGKTEGGDVALAIAAGAIDAAHVKGDLFDLCRGRHPGRTGPEEITLFKSVGSALEDLAAAMLVWRLAQPEGPDGAT